MAKQRYIDTRFWHDNFIRESLNPLDRYLFLYFLTNDKTNIAGVYELPISMIASETGIEKEMIKKMLPRLKGKVDYYDGWVVIRNFQKYQATNNIKIKQGIENEMSMIPNKIRLKIGYQYPIDEQSHLNLNSNTNSNLNSNPNTKQIALRARPPEEEFIPLFESVNPNFQAFFKNKTERAALKWLFENYGADDLKAKIAFLPTLNAMPFAPAVTTPFELKAKMGKVMAFLSQTKNKVETSKQKIFR